MKLQIVADDVPSSPYTRRFKPLIRQPQPKIPGTPEDKSKKVHVIDKTKQDEKPAPKQVAPVAPEPAPQATPQEAAPAKAEKPKKTPRKKNIKPPSKEKKSPEKAEPAKEESKEVALPKAEPATKTIEEIPESKPESKATPLDKIEIPALPEQDLVDLSSPAQMALSISLIVDNLTDNAKSTLESIKGISNEDLSKNPAQAKEQLGKILGPINTLMRQLKEVTDAIGSQAKTV